ncbi:MAG: hypothetical protein JNM00_11710, partial [Flavobacteriales bacterium]|nr:hypothetical protein [Flavobacteriales bacterium]
MGLVLGLMLMQPVAASASESGAEGKFNAGEMIMHHIQDAHSIHVIGDFTIPLPCIVKTPNGWDFFSSSVFMDEHHGFTRQYHSESTGNTYALMHEQIVIVNGAHAEAHAPVPMESHAAEEMHGDVHHEVADTTSATHTETVAHEAGDHGHGTPVMDFSITKSVLGMLLMLTLVVLLFVRMAKAYQKRKGQA